MPNEPLTPEEKAQIGTELKLGDNNAKVREVQDELARVNLIKKDEFGNPIEEGYGVETKQGVKAQQKFAGIQETGVWTEGTNIAYQIAKDQANQFFIEDISDQGIGSLGNLASETLLDCALGVANGNFEFDADKWDAIENEAIGIITDSYIEKVIKDTTGLDINLNQYVNTVYDFVKDGLMDVFGIELPPGKEDYIIGVVDGRLDPTVKRYRTKQRGIQADNMGDMPNFLGKQPNKGIKEVEAKKGLPYIHDDFSAYIYNHNTGSKIILYFLPEQIDININANFEDQEVRGRSSPFKGYSSSSGEEYSLSFTLVADYCPDGFIETIQKIKALAYPHNANTLLPPKCFFRFGKLISSNAVCTSVSVSYSGPYKDNIYSVAEISLSLSQIEQVGKFDTTVEKERIS